MRWFYCKGCGEPAVIMRDGTAGHVQPECEMFNELASLDYAEANRDAILCPTPPEFADRANELG